MKIMKNLSFKMFMVDQKKSFSLIKTISTPTAELGRLVDARGDKCSIKLKISAVFYVGLANHMPCSMNIISMKGTRFALMWITSWKKVYLILFAQNHALPVITYKIAF